MTDPTARLKAALDASRANHAPSREERARALDAAMRAFDAQAAESTEAAKGTAGAARPTPEAAPSRPGLIGRTLMTIAQLARPRGIAVGGAAVAAVALAFVVATDDPSLIGPPAVSPFPALRETAPAQPRAPGEAEAPRSEVREADEAPGRTDATLLDADASSPTAPVVGRSDDGARAPVRAEESFDADVRAKVSGQVLELRAADPGRPQAARRLAREAAPSTSAPAPAAGYALQAPPPAAESRDRYPDYEPGGVTVTAENPVSTFSIDVDTAAYGIVRRHLESGALPPPQAVRIEEMVNYFPYDHPAPDGDEAPFRATVSVAPSPWAEGRQLMHVAIRGHQIAEAEKPRANLVFLIDTSGSMGAPDKLPLLIKSLKLMLTKLDEDDRVSIVAYAGSAGVVLPPTPASERATIIAALDRLGAGGSTAGGAGLTLAYALARQEFDAEGVNRVILATDGDFNVGVSSAGAMEDMVERERGSGVYLSVLGFGMGNLNDELMQRIAQAGNGSAAYIDGLNEARKALVEEAGGALFPIAQDVKIQVEFNPAAVTEYRLIGYETRVLAREDFNNDRVDAGEIGSGHRVTAIYEITPAGGPRRTDPLRYGAKAPEGPADEIANVKIRWKKPGEDVSRLIETPVMAGGAAATLDAAPQEVRFGVAVAAFGEWLRGGEETNGFGPERIAALAAGARGDDPFGYRAEFLQLVRLAGSIAEASGRGR